MRGYFLLILFVFVSISACKKGVEQNTDDTPCTIQACTLNFASVTVRFLDKTGQAIVIANYSAINQRTGIALKYNSAVNVNYTPGVYTVASDSNLKELSTDGDDILVTATNPLTGQTKSATVRVSGGCVCHISKISGPTDVVFN